MKMAKSKDGKPKPQPSKYDAIALEAEFISGDSDNVAKFFKERKIPLKTGYRLAQGWVEKRRAIRLKGLEILQEKQAQKIAKALEYQMTAGAGLMKVGADQLFPEDPTKALKPQTAGEAAKVLSLGASIQQRAISTVLGMHPDLSPSQGKIVPGPGVEGGTSIVQVVINMPTNNREAQA